MISWRVSAGLPWLRDVFIKSLNVTLNLAMDYDFVIKHLSCGWNKAETQELADQLGASWLRSWEDLNLLQWDYR